MGQHSAPQPLPARRDAATIVLQLQLVIPKEVRYQYPHPIREDAGNVAREMLKRWEAGELPTQELLEMADSVTAQVTKVAGLKNET